MSREKLKSVHRDMKTRCYNENRDNYKHYGGRGIKVCDEWIGVGGFKAFLQDMEHSYQEGLQLDRIDNDGDYTKDNCRWVTAGDNMRNRGSHKNTSSTHKGVTWRKDRSKWCAKIKYKGKDHHIGMYDNEEEAALAYNKKAQELDSNIRINQL